MFLLGTFVNTFAVLLGSALGAVLPRVADNIKSTVMQGLALAVILIGLGDSLSDQGDILIVILSLVIGGVLGEWLRLEYWLDRVGKMAERRMKGSDGSVAEAFVTASLVFCVGALSFVGALQSGLQDNNLPLYAKSMLDFVSSIVFTSTLGIGVMLSAAPVLLYEGSIATIAYLAGNAINDPPVIAAMTATGGLLIVAIGLNLLGVRRIPAANLLPAMFVAALLKTASSPVLDVVHRLLR